MTPAEQYRFEFRGTGGEYFRIWIVNLALTIVTLGIYSAWAKVRRKRYFYGNTGLAGASFDYLADPIKILKGRLIVAGVFIPVAVLASFIPFLDPLFSLIIFLVFPWLFVRSQRFNATNSAYRNIRFRYSATYGNAVAVFIGIALLIPFSLGLAYPYFAQQRFKLVLDHHRFGTTPMAMDAGVKPFFINYLLAALLFWGGIFAATMAFGVTLAVIGDGTGQGAVAGFLLLLLGLALIFGLLFTFTFLRVRNLNTVWNHTRLGDNSFRSELRVGRLYWISLVNALAVVVSFGLLIPWAQVRVAQYRAACTSLLLEGSFADFVAGEADRIEALGEEFADALDFDFGL